MKIIVALVALKFCISIQVSQVNPSNSSIPEDLCLNLTDHNICYSRSNISVPKNYGTKTPYFIAREALRERERLSQKSKAVLKLDPKCRPVLLYILVRHATRFPDERDVKVFSKKLPGLRDRIVSSGATGKGQGSLCPEDIEKLKGWTLGFEERLSKAISPAGVNETLELARSWKKMYPELLDPKYSKFDVGYTSKIRTKETAIAFLQGLLGGPITNLNDSTLGLSEQSFVNYQSKCENIQKTAGVKPYALPKPLLQLRQGQTFQRALEAMSQRLGFSTTTTGNTTGVSSDPINYNTLTSLIVKICHLEFVSFGDSPWCLLIPPSIWSLLEYDHDLGDILLFAYGNPIMKKASCVIIGDFVKKLHLYLEAQRSDSRGGWSPLSNLKTYLRFTHSTSFKGILAGLGLFDDWTHNHNFSRQGYCHSLGRAWRSSHAIPFDANIGFTLYKCHLEGSVRLKVVTRVQEIPVIVGKCKGLECDLDDFLMSFGAAVSSCDLDKICDPASYKGSGRLIVASFVLTFWALLTIMIA